jgi:hypothetical protein
MERRLSDLRLIEELDHQREIDIEPKNIIRTNLTTCAEPGDASEDSHPLNGVLVLQKR